MVKRVKKYIVFLLFSLFCSFFTGKNKASAEGSNETSDSGQVCCKAIDVSGSAIRVLNGLDGTGNCNMCTIPLPYSRLAIESSEVVY